MSEAQDWKGKDKRDGRDHLKIVVSAKIETEDRAEGERAERPLISAEEVRLSFFGEKEERKSAENSNRPSFALSFDSSSVKRRGRRSRRSRRRKALSAVSASVCRSESEISRAIVQIERERGRSEGANHP